MAAMVGVAMVAVLGYAGVDKGALALLAAAGVLVLGAVSADMTVLPLLAFPCMLLLYRAGPLSLSDLVLFLASLCALTQLHTRESPELRRLVWVVIGYQAALVPTLVYNRYPANYIEWVHELFLVGGALAVGFVVGRSGRARVAVSLYVIPVVVLAVAVCLLAPARHFQPIDLFIFQKNALGDMFAFVAVIAYARPSWLGWRAWTCNAIAVICALGTLACQSRQGMISVAVGIAVVAVRGHVQARRSRMILLAVMSLLVVAYVVTANQLSSTGRFDSAHQRLTWYGQSVNIWRTSRLVGVGLRWWYTGRFGAGFQPPNAEFEVLTSAGVIGLAGFLISVAVALWVLWHMDPRYGTIAVAIVVVRLVQGQLDLFWVASQSSLPWLIVGLALGAQALAQAEEAESVRATRPAGESARPIDRLRGSTPTLAVPSDR